MSTARVDPGVKPNFYCFRKISVPEGEEEAPTIQKGKYEILSLKRGRITRKINLGR